MSSNRDLGRSGKEHEGAGARGRRWVLALLVLLVLVVVPAGSWVAGRVTAEARRIEIHRIAEPGPPPGAEGAVELRILAWNVAHGRGDARSGLLRNWRGGDEDVRARRLAAMGRLLREANPDVVVLNEVDFRSSWSGGVNQARHLAQEGSYGTWVEQRNYDLRFGFWTFDFGNAVLSRLPVGGARWLRLPPHSRLEELLVGSKSAAIVRLETGAGPLSLVPVHLEARSGETRIRAVERLAEVRERAPGPVVLAGDFNAAPTSSGGGDRGSVMDSLLARGWTSPRARRPPDSVRATYPTWAPGRSLDWILVEPPLEVVEARVLHQGAELSDHLPVLAVVRYPEGSGPGDGDGGDGGDDADGAGGGS